MLPIKHRQRFVHGFGGERRFSAVRSGADARVGAALKVRKAAASAVQALHRRDYPDCQNRL